MDSKRIYCLKGTMINLNVIRYLGVLIALTLFNSHDLFGKPTVLKITLNKKIILSDVPSASGIECVGEKLYLIGDDSRYLFVLDKNYVLESRHLIWEKRDSNEEALEGRIPKGVKHDFEAITWIGEDIFIFGSGSIARNRDNICQFSPKQLTSSIIDQGETFYNRLRNLVNTELNIEGAAAIRNTLYLLNRNQNQVITIDLTQLGFGVKGKNPAVFSDAANFNITTHNIHLPVTDNIQAGLSGACILPGTHKMVFTASLEDTPNWIDDGAIAGSYLGILNLETKSVEACMPILENDKPLLLKIESVAVKEKNRDGFTIVMVADQDGGESVLLESTLYYP